MGETDKMEMVGWVMEHSPKCIENLDGGIMHDACLQSFHHGTCPRRLNCQVFTSGCFIFLYFFDFLTLDLAEMILAFFSYF